MSFFEWMWAGFWFGIGGIAALLVVIIALGAFLMNRR
jgi:uncharacterized membrane protein